MPRERIHKERPALRLSTNLVCILGSEATRIVFGHRIKNPIGTSAGIDKHAEIPSALLALGPSIIEIGAVTPKPQEGNPKPRVFRLASQKALVNRYGFNSEGAEAVAARLRKRVRRYAYAIGLGKGELAEQLVLDGEAGVPAGSLTDGKLMAVQVAKNKSTSEKDIEAVKDDYVYCVKRLAKYADIIVVNVSSPNTPGLRTLQNVGPLTSILTSVVEAASKTQRRTKPSVMVKVSPDEDSDDQVSGICEAIWESGVQGVIVANSTLQRPEPLPRGSVLPEVESRLLQEQGGYSGPQLFDRTLALVRKYRSVLDRGPQRSLSDQEGKFTAQPSAEGSSDSTSSAAAGQTSQPLFQLPERHKTSPSSNTDSQQPPRGEGSFGPERKVIFASGGITNGKQALEVLDAGASVAMMYTAIVYGGVGTITRVKGEMRSEKRHRRLADEH
ncbi:MAG: hypothetical protein M1825_001390 [Sarcosagium campestre]|nr:MAG: hypothetical protein M1825_001390 [Sarcosagium campestre]